MNMMLQSLVMMKVAEQRGNKFALELVVQRVLLIKIRKEKKETLVEGKNSELNPVIRS